MPEQLSKGAQMLMDGHNQFNQAFAAAGGAPSEEEQSIQQAMHEEVDKRMHNALDDIKEKYEGGRDRVGGGPSRGPTGDLYKEKAAAERAQRAAERAVEGERAAEVRAQAAAAAAEEEGGSDSDEELLEGLDEIDPAVRELREKRLAQMKKQHAERLENLAAGHGRYDEIVQDEFLPTVLKSKRCVVHFYHPDFERCKVMDHHLSKLCPSHIEAKFAKINAEKTPFFVQKLGVRVMPTVLCFVDGICQDQRIVGFEGLCDDLPAGKEDEWPTERLAELLADAGIIDYEAQASEQELAKYTLAGARAAMMAGGSNDLDLED